MNHVLFCTNYPPYIVHGLWHLPPSSNQLISLNLWQNILCKCILQSCSILLTTSCEIMIIQPQSLLGLLTSIFDSDEGCFEADGFLMDQKIGGNGILSMQKQCQWLCYCQWKVWGHGRVEIHLSRCCGICYWGLCQPRWWYIFVALGGGLWKSKIVHKGTSNFWLSWKSCMSQHFKI